MSLSAREISKLQKIVDLASELLAKAASAEPKQTKQSAKSIAATVRKRRSGKELVAFRKMLKAERKRGVPVLELARQHGISPAYIYSI